MYMGPLVIREKFHLVLEVKYRKVVGIPEYAHQIQGRLILLSRYEEFSFRRFLREKYEM